jgi:hypothetical protein
LKKKLDMFYEALGWGEVVDKQNSMERFFWKKVFILNNLYNSYLKGYNK